MGALSLADVHVHGDEPCIADLRLAEGLGFDRARNIRNLISRHRDEIQRYGELRVTLERNSGRRGAPERSFWLNEAQALLVCMFARTPKAAEIRQQVIEVFLAWRRGALAAPALPPPIDPWERMVDRLHAYSAQIEFTGAHSASHQALAATHLPIWTDGHRPAFWGDLDVREFLTTCHRQMTEVAARAACERQFGAARTPSKSALNRYWQRLDRARGGERLVRRGPRKAA